MAEADPLLDDDLTREDRQTVAEIEGNQPQSGEGPEPVDLDEINPAPPVSPPLDLTPPEIGSEGPTRQEPIPGMPAQVPAAPVETPMSEDIARRQGEQDKANAAINAATAQRMANEAQAADEDARLERADYLQRRQDAEKDLDARIKQYEQARLVNPREHVSTKSRLAVIFGGLGAALRSAGGGSSENRALDQLQKQWDDDTAIQKANIATLRDTAVMARTRLEDVDTGRRQMLRDADARLLAKYNLALKQGEAQLKSQGASQAEIDADGRIVKLRAAQAAAKIQAQKDADAHALNQARIGRLNAQAARDQRKGKGGGGPSRKQQLADSREERADAKDTMTEVREAVKPFLAKGGTRDSLQHVSAAIDKVEENPNNPTEWVNLIDGMIRSNTGRAAIKAQYDLYVSHAHGTVDTFDAWVDKLKSGLPSEEQRRNLLQGAKSAKAEYQREAKDFHDNLRSTYDNDSRLRENPRAWEAYNRLNQTTFGTLQGYQKPGAAPAAPPAPVKGGPPTVNAGPTAEQVKQAKVLINLPPNDPRRTPEREAKARKIISDAAAPIKL